VTRRILQLLADLAGHSFRLLPERLRFTAALRIAMILAPLVRRLPYYKRRPSALDGFREESLRMVLRAMTRTRVPYDTDLVIRGHEVFPASGPVLIAGAHFLLSVHQTRWMYEAGRTFTAVIGMPREPIYYSGTLVPIDRLLLNGQILVQVREAFRRGSIVFIALDDEQPHGNRTRVETAGGARWVSDVPFRFAARTRTPVVFESARVENGQLIITYARPEGDADQMFREYCDFLRDQAGRVAR
jgi:hypothetical protein